MSRKNSLRRRLRRSLKHRPGVLPWLLFQPQRLLFFLLRLLPEPFLLNCAHALGKRALHRSSRLDMGREHLRQAFPDWNSEKCDLVLRESAGHFARTVVEALVLWPGSDLKKRVEQVQFEPGAKEMLLSMRRRGALFLQAHLGSVEMTCSLLGGHGLEAATPMRPPNNWYLAKKIRESRNRIGTEVILRQGALKQMFLKLQAGGSVILTFDQNAHQKPIFVPWFGKSAATERTPVALAQKLAGPVLVCWCVRQDSGGFLFGCRLLADPVDPNLSQEALTGKFHEALENVIRRFPEQYLWLHDRYRTRPPEET